jgi:hypothetical protein
VYLVSQILSGSDTSTAVTTQIPSVEQCEGFNSAISPRLPRRRASTSHEDFSLGPAGKKKLRKRCTLLSCTKYYASFVLTWDVSTNVARSICRADHLTRLHRQGGVHRVRYATKHITNFLPVYHCGVVTFLEWLIATSKFPFPNVRKNQVSSLLMTNVYWKEILFDKASSTISRTNVDALF